MHDPLGTPRLVTAPILHQSVAPVLQAGEREAAGAQEVHDDVAGHLVDHQARHAGVDRVRVPGRGVVILDDREPGQDLGQR